LFLQLIYGRPQRGVSSTAIAQWWLVSRVGRVDPAESLRIDAAEL